jgi:hypothetical protein
VPFDECLVLLNYSTMATKGLYNTPNSNPFELLQQESGAAAAQTKRAPKAGDADYVPQTPAEKAKLRAAQQAIKAAELEAIKKQQAAEAALAAQAGPLEGFVTQKGSQPRKAKEDAKKMNRETYEKTGGQASQNSDKRPPRGDGSDKKPFEGKRQFDGEKKQFKGERKPRVEGEEGRKGPKREFDKHSAGKTSNKFQDKRGGRGQANWGSPVDAAAATTAADWGEPAAPAAEATTETAGWGDEGVAKTVQAAAGWGTEGEKTAEAAEDVKEEEKVPRGPAWDEVEGFGKMTLAEYQKVQAQKEAELAAKLGAPKEKRVVETDTSKFLVLTADKSEVDRSLPAKKDTKKGQQRAGTKPVDLGEVFAVRGSGGRGRGGRGGFQGDRQQGGQRGRGGQHKVPTGAKQFPDLVPQTAKNAKA